jgi:single-strand DNA-binding protein
MYPAFVRAPLRGFFHAPCGSSLFCFGCAAIRVTVSLQILFGKKAEKISPEPPQMQSFGTWEHGPLALLVPRSNREIQQTETIMYQNKVTLIGFLGSNAEARTNSPDFSVTTLSLATKSSYKKDGKYISHTEWHRCVVFGKLSEFAKTLTKGAHIQVEGELRSREYDSKKTDSKRRVWEIRVASILKLDRAENAAAEDQEHDESPQEETAA